MNEARKGSLFSVYVFEGGDYRLLCGLQATSVTISQEGVDTTDNCSGSIRQMLEGAGVRSFSISGNGITRLPSALSFLLSIYFAQSHIDIKVKSGTLELYSTMQIASIGDSASHNGAELFEITLESTGRVTTSAEDGILAEDGVQIFTEDDQSLQPEVI